MRDLMERLRAWFDRDYRTTAAKMVRDLQTQLRRTEDDLHLMRERDQKHFNEIMAMRARLEKVIDDPAMQQYFKKELREHIHRLATNWFNHAHDEYFRLILPNLLNKADLRMEIISPVGMDFERLGFSLDMRIPAVGHRQPIL